MSLKHFHLFFIACSLALMAYLAAWGRAQGAHGILACGTLGCAAALGYLSWFVAKHKTLT
jgi:hypothetical protein